MEKLGYVFNSYICVCGLNFNSAICFLNMNSILYLSNVSHQPVRSNKADRFKPTILFFCTLLRWYKTSVDINVN